MSTASDNEKPVQPPMTLACESIRRANIQMAQALVGQDVPPEVSLVDELLSQRRKENAGE